jgi:hypothetical protein
MRHNPGLVLRHAHKISSQAVGRTAQRGTQHLEQAVPRGGELRAALACDEFAGGAEHDAILDAHTEIATGVEAHRRRRAVQFRVRHDAGAASRQRHRRAFVEGHFPPAVLQIEG